VNYLYFGEATPETKIENTMKHFISEKEIQEQLLGISYIYFLEIVEKNQVYSNGTIWLRQATSRSRFSTLYA
jgi:hypothetical protein